MTDVCVLGLGYIGLPTASILANNGFRVVGVDVNKKILHALQHGMCTICEPSLDAMLKSAILSRQMTFSDKPCPADVYMICVPTPFTDGHKPDLKYVNAAIESIAPHLHAGNLIILESTVPVGTTEKIATIVTGIRPDLTVGSKTGEGTAPVYVAHCPERVLPGNILQELRENDRIVGGIDPESTNKGVSFYRRFVTGLVQGTDSRTAEMIKLTENSFRDVNIAFANELSLICAELDLDVWKVIALANRHPRVNILQPGPGVGGHCIAVDPWFLVDSAPRTARLIRTAREVNDAKPSFIIHNALEALKRHTGATIACLGLTFKPNVEDLRESPALCITETLAGRGIPILVCEPHIHELPQSLNALPNVRKEDLAGCLQQADIILILVRHSAFLSIDPAGLSSKTLIDACGLWQGAMASKQSESMMEGNQ